MTLSNALKSARLSAHLSQRKLASVSGIDQGMISTVENGKNSTSFENVERWLAACGSRIVVVPRDAVVDADIGKLDAAQQQIVRDLVRILPLVPVPVVEHLGDTVRNLVERYGTFVTEPTVVRGAAGA